MKTLHAIIQLLALTLQHYWNDKLQRATSGIKWEKGKRATSDNNLGLEDEVSNVYVKDLLDRRCDLINTGQLIYK